MSGESKFLDDHISRWVPEPNSGCYLWVGSKTSSGYGNLTRNGQSVYAHRTVYEDVHGVGSALGFVIRHKCDNPCCVNPAHLLRGSHADNHRDMIERNRQNFAHGERCHRAKISDKEALRIRALSGTKSAAQIAEEEGIPYSVVRPAISGTSFKHIGGVIDGRVKFRSNKPTRRGEDAANAHLTADEVAKIRVGIASGEKGVDLARRFGVHPVTISAIKHGRIWAKP